MDPKAALRQLVDYMARNDWDTALERALAVQSWGAKGGVMPRMSKLERQCYQALLELDEATQNAANALEASIEG